VLIGKDLGVLLSNGGDLGRRSVVLLDQNHGESYTGTLTNKVDGIFGERFEKCDSIL
jgi:hypothetical protein